MKPFEARSDLRGFSLLPHKLGKSLAQIERELGVKADFRHAFKQSQNLDRGRRAVDVFSFEAVLNFS